MIHAHVIDDQQVRLEVTREGFVFAIESRFVQEVTHDIKDRTVQYREASFDCRVTNRLTNVALPSAGRPEETLVVCLSEFGRTPKIQLQRGA